MKAHPAAVLATLVVACTSGGNISYDAAGDARFAGLVTGTWVTRDGATKLTVCEDATPDRWACREPSSEASPVGCSELCHVARGGGAGTSETLGGGSGCPTPIASLSVRLSGAGIDAHGEADVAPETFDAYGGPIALSADGSSSAPSVLHGSVGHDGTMALTVRQRQGDGPSVTTSLTLVHATGAPVPCP
jgi:hypothetical protein